MKIFSGSSNKSLAERIAHALSTQLSPIEIFVFPDGEKRIQIQERVVDEDTVVVQSTATPADANFMELFFIVDGLKRSGAKSVTAVIPYLGYQRQDHVFRDGEAVSLDVVVHALERTGATKAIAVDFHSIKIPEVFSVPVAHLSALPLFAEKIKELLRGRLPHVAGDAQRVFAESSEDFSSSLNERQSTTSQEDPNGSDGLAFNSPASGQTSSITKLVDGFLASPDMGGLRRINKMSELLDGMPWIATVKDRDLNTGNITINKIEGDPSVIKGTAFIVDDMISSGKTIAQSAKLLHEQYGVENLYVFATHPVFSDEASKLLEESVVTKVFVTDSVLIPEEKRFPKLEVLTVADMVAEELRQVTSDR